MSSQLVGPKTEAAIWARLMEARKGDLSPEAAEYLLSIGFADSDRRRMEELAERSQAGILTDEEGAEYDSYLHVGNLLAVMQSKARVALRRELVDEQQT